MDTEGSRSSHCRCSDRRRQPWRLWNNYTTNEWRRTVHRIRICAMIQPVEPHPIAERTAQRDGAGGGQRRVNWRSEQLRQRVQRCHLCPFSLLPLSAAPPHRDLCATSLRVLLLSLSLSAQQSRLTARRETRRKHRPQRDETSRHRWRQRTQKWHAHDKQQEYRTNDGSTTHNATRALQTQTTTRTDDHLRLSSGASPRSSAAPHHANTHT